jgi:hypothetical protein
VAEFIAHYWQGLIAILALIISGWRLFLSHRHNQISVMPHLDLDVYSNPKRNIFRIDVINNGVGPAKITLCEMHPPNAAPTGDVDNGLRRQVMSFLANLGSGDAEVSGRNIQVGEHIPAGTTKTLINVAFIDETPHSSPFAVFREWVTEYDIVIHYTSLYGSGWRKKVYKLDTRGA